MVPSRQPPVGLAAAAAAAEVKADVRTMGPPWELRDGDGVPLLRGQECEVKTQYHVVTSARAVLSGDLFVCDPQGTRYAWDRKTFRWNELAPVAQR